VVVDQEALEYSTLKVEKSYRICLPQPLVRRADWIAGERPVRGWLLVGNSGRCRLLSSAQVDKDPDCQALRARVAAETGASSASPLDFDDEASAVLALRFAPVEITPPKPGWRLTLPRAIAAIMQVRAGESYVAGLFLRSHIEIWTMETLKSAMNVPLTEII